MMDSAKGDVLRRCGLWLAAAVAALLVCGRATLAAAQSDDGHGIMSLSEIYDIPDNYVTRATVVAWRRPFALTENIYTRVDAAFGRPFLNWFSEVPKLGPKQRNIDFRIDVGTLPLVFGPFAAGAGVSLLDTTTFHFAKPIGSVHAGEDYVTGFGVYALAGAVLGQRAAVFAHKGTAWVSGGMVHNNQEVVAYVVAYNGLGLTGSWSKGELLDPAGKSLVSYDTYTVGIGSLSIQ